MTNKVAVVSGATSFIASGLIDELVKRGVKVYALCRKDSKNLWRLPVHPLVTAVDCTLDSLETVTLPEPCDVFYHLAWSTAEKNDFYLQNLNVKYSLDSVHLAKKLGCGRFLFAGSQAEFGLANVPLFHDTPCFPVTGYGMAKLCAGQMCREESKKLGISFIWTRILSVYGELDNPNTLYSYLIRCFKEHTPPQLTSCTQIWDYMPIQQCSEILWRLTEKHQEDKIYVIGSGDAPVLRDFVESVRDRMAPDCPISFGVKEPPANTPTRLQSGERFCGLTLDES